MFTKLCNLFTLTPEKLVQTQLSEAKLNRLKCLTLAESHKLEAMHLENQAKMYADRISRLETKGSASNLFASSLILSDDEKDMILNKSDWHIASMGEKK